VPDDPVYRKPSEGFATDDVIGGGALDDDDDDVKWADPAIALEYNAALGEFVVEFNGLDNLVSKLRGAARSSGSKALYTRPQALARRRNSRHRSSGAISASTASPVSFRRASLSVSPIASTSTPASLQNRFFMGMSRYIVLQVPRGNASAMRGALNASSAIFSDVVSCFSTAWRLL